jgi:DNA mismatch endonuclease, patch repair protein
MVDNLKPAARSHAMRQVRSRNTAPEKFVRGMLRDLGQGGYRVHRRDLPGAPDVVWIGKRRALFVHGCFWHGHGCRRGRRMPVTNRPYWSAKIARNRLRDARARAALRKLGWQVLVVWECQLRDPERLRRRLHDLLGRGRG